MCEIATRESSFHLKIAAIAANLVNSDIPPGAVPSLVGGGEICFGLKKNTFTFKVTVRRGDALGAVASGLECNLKYKESVRGLHYFQNFS